MLNENIAQLESTNGLPINVEVFYWKGQPRYRCLLHWESGGKCDYDSHDPEKLFQHMKMSHTYTGQGLTEQQSTMNIKPDAPDPEFKDVKFADESEKVE